jgi:molybdopterin converting factor small subunit
VSIDIELFGQLLPDQPRRRDFQIQKPTAVREIARAIGLDPSEIGMIAIDGVQSELDDVVSPGSRLCFFPYVSGG